MPLILFWRHKKIRLSTASCWLAMDKDTGEYCLLLMSSLLLKAFLMSNDNHYQLLINY